MAQPTRFYASSRPLDVFNDDAFFENEAPMTSHAPMPNPSKPMRRPLGTSSTPNVILLEPAVSHGSKFSPYKGKAPRPPLKPSHGLNKFNGISMAPPTDRTPVTDSLQKKPQLSNFKTGLQKPQLSSTDPDAFFEKENVHPLSFPEPATIDLSVGQYFQNPPGKRGLMEAAPIIKDSRVGKKHKADEQSLPPHDSFPPITDDGTKPPHSYAQLIGMAILRSSKRRLTLAQIYKWISDNYSFYNPNDAGWQNSIRHNLSLHKNFIKIERPKDDPGKGNYWGIEPGTEFQFLKEKPTRKSVPTGENLPVMSTRLEPSRPTPALMPEPSLPPPIHHQQQQQQQHHSLPPLPTSQATTLSMPLEPSSDATILVSDNAPADDLADKGADNELLLESSFFSPLPAALNSTPPMPRAERRNGTPPPMNRNPAASSAARTHKRKFASMDDSGYISSLESSAMRPNATRSAFFTSEPDRHRIKRGRAEEEIARLRGSSPFSPSKSRPFSSYGINSSSSPFRPSSSDNQMPPPLTPVVKKVKAVLPPPPSVSPNTNLRIHRAKVRHLLQSPLRRVANLAGEDCLPWSPAFRLDDNIFSFDTPTASSSNLPDFDIFQDLPVDDENVFDSLGPAYTGSPVKRSVKRARLDRSVSSSAIGGGELSASSKRLLGPAPLLKAPDTPSQFLETPSKVFEGLSSPSKLFQQSPIKGASPTKFASLLELPGDGDWPSLHMDSHDFATGAGSDGSDFTGLDILQGFEKIGSGSQQPSRGGNRGGKPALGRSFSTAF